MATPVIISLLVGLVAGEAFMAMWAANRIEEEGVRQFDRGFERGRWLTDISAARAVEDQDRAPRVGLLVARAGSPSVRPPSRRPLRSPVRRCSSFPREAGGAAPAAAGVGSARARPRRGRGR
jgi:hypothetical protein